MRASASVPSERFGRRFILLLSSCLFVLPNLAQAVDVTVDCTGGTPGAFTSITAALDTLDQQGPHTIFIKPCHYVERVLVMDRERITFDASPLGGAFVDSPDGSAPIVISGSHAISLIQMGATGSGFNGIVVNRHSEASILGMTIQGNGGNGVAVRGASTVLFADNNISFNGTNGVNVVEDSVGTFVGSAPGANGLLLEGNSSAGLRCSHGAVCFINGFLTAQNNGFGGLIVSNGARAQIESDDGPNTFQGNAFAGIVLARNASAVIFGSSRTFVRNNTGLGFDVEGNSSLVVFDTTVTNNSRPGLSAVRISLAEFGGNNVFTGNGTANLTCDATSLLSGELTGIQNISCLKIERAKGPPRPGKVDN